MTDTTTQRDELAQAWKHYKEVGAKENFNIYADGESFAAGYEAATSNMQSKVSELEAKIGKIEFENEQLIHNCGVYRIQLNNYSVKIAELQKEKEALTDSLEMYANGFEPSKREVK